MRDYRPGGPDEAAAATLHRLCTLSRKMGVRSFIAEDVLDRPDIVAELDHLEAHRGVEQGEATAVCVTFLKCRRLASKEPGEVPAKAVVGQAVIISFPTAKGPRTFVYEALFRPPSTGANHQPLANHYVPIARKATLHCKGHDHVVRVTYFCEQNGVTSSCGHCAARTLLWYINGKVIETAALNEKWKYQPGRTRVTSVMIEDAVRQPDQRAVAYDLVKNVPRSQNEFVEDVVWGLLTCLAELPTPTLLGLRTSGRADHIVSVVGHTLNTDEWHPHGIAAHLNAREPAASTSLWVDHLVMHDDMLGPYYCLSRAALYEPGETRAEKQARAKNKTLPATQKRQTIKPLVAITWLPPGVSVSPRKAEEVARDAFPELAKVLPQHGYGKGRWWDLLCQSSERRIFRTTLIERDAYIESLQALRELKRNPIAPGFIDAITRSLPERMWMCEVTLPNLFLGNRAKLGELLISATDIPAYDATDGLLAFRLPSLLGWQNPQQPKGMFQVRTLAVRGHQPMHAPGRHGHRW